MSAIQQVLLMAAGAGSGDPDFANVGLLLHCDGSNGGTTFTDSSSNGHTVTPTSVTTSTAQAKFGATSALIASSANTNRLEVSDDASLVASTEDFTIECWVYFTSVASAAILYNKAFGTGLYPYQLYKSGGNNFGFRGFDNASSLIYDLTGTTSVTTGQWYFVQARRSSGTFALAVDGTQEATTTISSSTVLLPNAAPVSIGNYGNAAASFPVIGYMDDIRFTKNVARTFALPTAAFPDS